MRKLEADRKAQGETGDGRIVETTGPDFKKVVVTGGQRGQKEKNTSQYSQVVETDRKRKCK